MARPDSVRRRTAVHSVASQGHQAVLCLLLENTEEASVVNMGSQGATPLMLAAAPGHCGCLRLLLEYGSDPAAVDLEGRTALAWSVTAGQEEAVALLLAAGGIGEPDKKGRTPHHRAAAYGQVSVLCTLVMAGDKAQVDRPDKDGFTPLHHAAYHGQEGTLELLLGLNPGAMQGSESDGADSTSNTISPLHCAVTSGHELCLKLLLDHSAAQVNSSDALGFTPLHIAARRNLLDSVRLLVQQKAELNCQDLRGRSPVMLAAEAGHLDLLEFLLDQGARQDTVDSKGNTALHLACQAGHTSTANLLLGRPCSPALVSLQNKAGKSPLHLAAGRGLVDTGT